MNSSSATLKITELFDKMKSASTWLHDSLAPQFRAALIQRLGISNSPLSNLKCTAELTLKAYQNLAIGLPMASAHEPLLVNAHETERDLIFWRKVSLLISEDTTIVQSSLDRSLVLTGALSIVASACPVTANVITRWVSHIVPITSPTYRSASHPHIFGILFINLDRRPEDIAVSLVHELAHQELFLLNLVDRLVVESNDYNLAHAPFQNRLRPPIGRLHSAHALHRMIQFERIAFPEAACHHVDLLRRTIDAFQNGELTPVADQLLRDVYE